MQEVNALRQELVHIRHERQQAEDCAAAKSSQSIAGPPTGPFARSVLASAEERDAELLRLREITAMQQLADLTDGADETG